ncbi:serine hydrolase [Pedobacter foliorum]|uniref:serine hydrolase domain-containing protein n=1 Tax=Pedobacter foliorum TaxID=2739058 RepID=UPI001563C266|nr:serine hydrolase [Pedobacter foliorum]NRF40572.1 serine hydrolase [Pedobacter foliorum]
MKQALFLLTFLLVFSSAKSQDLAHFADSIRVKSEIPELSYAALTADSVLIKNTLGFRRSDLQNAETKANANDYFHLGSNTKAITGFIAGYLVENKKISWTTKFFTLFPEWKKDANPAFYEITLLDLLSHRAHVKPYNSGVEFQSLPKFTGTKAEQRRLFVKYLIENDALEKNNETYNYSNAGYSVATTMLEKASGKTWEQLLDEVLSKKLHLNYKLEWPNRTDVNQPWGHWIENNKLTPLSPHTDYNLNLIEPAGDISMPIADYIKFVQMNLAGLRGKNNLIKPETYNFLHYGLKDYAIGWLNVNKPDNHSSEHAGSAGTFYCYTLINKDKNVAYIIMANSATEDTLKGIFKLLEKLIKTVETKI